MTYHMFLKATAVSAILVGGAALPVQAVFFHVGNGSIDGSLCLGNDCVASEAFGFDTLRFKENNLRVHFDDTSSAASFPNNDWRIIINDSANGGKNFLAIEDATAAQRPFKIEAGAPSGALYVDDGGRIGIGTQSPAVSGLHVKKGNTPTLRLEQDGSSGFTAQTWDLAGNEANFFIRDVTGGSRLPFRIRPDAPTSAIDIQGDGDVGLNTSSPQAALHVVRTVAGAAELLRLSNNGTVFSGYEDTSVAAGDNTGRIWNIQNVGGEFRVTTAPGGAGEVELAMNAAGDLTISGGLITTGGGGTCTVANPCDAVFDPSVYTVPSIEEHAAFMWQNKHLPAVGPTGPDAPINMTEKMLTMLNELEHAHIYIDQLNTQLKEQGAEIETLKTQVASR